MQQTRFKYALWFSHFLVVGWLIATLLLNLLSCKPIEKHWEPLTPGYCFANAKLWPEIAILSVVIDLVLLFLPIPMLWRLQMKISRKATIVGVFACGFWYVAPQV